MQAAASPDVGECSKSRGIVKVLLPDLVAIQWQRPNGALKVGQQRAGIPLLSRLIHKTIFCGQKAIDLADMLHKVSRERIGRAVGDSHPPQIAYRDIRGADMHGMKVFGLPGQLTVQTP